MEKSWYVFLTCKIYCSSELWYVKKSFIIRYNYNYSLFKRYKAIYGVTIAW